MLETSQHPSKSWGPCCCLQWIPACAGMTKTNLFRVSIANFASFAGHLFFLISRIQAAVEKHSTRVHLRNPRRIRTFVRMEERLSPRSEENTTELQSLMRISYTISC